MFCLYVCVGVADLFSRLFYTVYIQTLKHICMYVQYMHMFGFYLHTNDWSVSKSICALFGKQIIFMLHMDFFVGCTRIATINNKGKGLNCLERLTMMTNMLLRSMWVDKENFGNIATLPIFFAEGAKGCRGVVGRSHSRRTILNSYSYGYVAHTGNVGNTRATNQAVWSLESWLKERYLQLNHFVIPDLKVHFVVIAGYIHQRFSCEQTSDSVYL